ncbi:putative AC9 transposase [Glycine soja]
MLKWVRLFDQSVNSIAPLETQQVANDAQSNPVEETENSPNIEEVEDVERSLNKRGLTSTAWTHFKRKKIEEKWKAICKYCEKKLGGDTRSSTKHLHNHIRTCKLRTVRGQKQSILKTLQQSSSSRKHWKTSSGDCVKFELDLYLEESVLFNQSNISNFDILGYWKNFGVKYPTLHRIAKDFLAIHISTVASESAFSIGGQFLTPHRSKLNEDIVEALMCSQDWLRNEIEGLMLKMFHCTWMEVPQEAGGTGQKISPPQGAGTGMGSRVRFGNGERGEYSPPPPRVGAMPSMKVHTDC